MLSIKTLLICSAWTLTATATVVYDTIPAALPVNVASLGYEATSTAEFGDAITPGSGSRPLEQITIVMSNWAPHSEWSGVGTEAGYTVPLTLNLYNTGAGTSVGSQIAAMTVNAFIPWRPEHDPTCSGSGWKASDGNCYNGIASEVVFDFAGQNILLPDTLIFGVAFNTQHYGYAPTGVAGPYNSLNFGVAGVLSAGTDVDADSVYWNTTHASSYTDGGAAGVGVFRMDTGWTGFTPMIRVEVAPEPASFALVGAALVLLQKLRSAARATRSNSE